MLCSVAETPEGNCRVLARNMRWVDDRAYIRRERDSLAIASDGYVPALAEADRVGATCLWVHTHPGNNALPVQSRHDRIVDCQLADLFRLRANSPFYGALVFSPREGGLAFTGFVEREGQDQRSIERLWQVGNRWRLTAAFTDQSPGLAELFDRNIRAFGPAIQATIGDLHVGIVGCGGTGSAVGEQLVRLGIRRFRSSILTRYRRAIRHASTALTPQASDVRKRCSWPSIFVA